MFPVVKAISKIVGGDAQVENPEATSESCCMTKNITGFKTPLDAYNNSEREKLLYTVALPLDETQPDYLVTIDTDPSSSTYSQVIGRLAMPNVGDELHHTGWNACISCKGGKSQKHKYLILPSLVSGNIYAVDVLTDPRNPKLFKEIKGEDVLKATGGSYPHTTHCLPSGDVMISFMGKNQQKAGGGFLILDGATFDIKGRWEPQSEGEQPFGYDFWYQPNHNIMVSSEFGAPESFMKGFDPSAVKEKYGSTLTFWNWKEQTIRNKVDLGNDGLIPLECRFLHNPQKNYGYVGAALSSTVVRYFPKENGEYATEIVATVDPIKVKGWALDTMPGLITDILISLDDKYLYVSLWIHGCINQYDISDPSNLKLVGQIWLGGSIPKGGSVIPIDENGNERLDLQKEVPVLKGKKLQGGPQMLQLSRDGKRLFVTSSLLRPWDKQFYPEQQQEGGQIVQVDVDTVNGGLTLNQDFLVTFENEPFGNAVAHEMRYPGGDCSSDIWV